MPYSVAGCSDIDKHSSSVFLSRKAILDALCQSDSDLRLTSHVESRLFVREQRIDDWFDTSVDESPEDLERGTQ